MRTSMRLCAGVLAALALLLVHMSPAFALPKPRKELYWFSWWELESKVWPITRGRGVTVAVIDYPVNGALADLKGAVLPNVNPETRALGVVPIPEKKSHGTSMAALIAGQGHGSGMVGVAPEAKILPIAYGDTGSDELVDKIRYAVDHGAKVINMSLAIGSIHPCPDHLQRAISYAIKKDAVLIAGAGNDGRINGLLNFPADCAGVLAVGGLDGHLKPWKGSTPGDYVGVAGPAVDIGSIARDGNFSWRGQNGTSNATALTSGVVALIRSKHPKMPAREVVHRITATAKDVGPAGWDDVTGYGLVRPYRALVDKLPADAPNPTYERFDRWKASPTVSPNAQNSSPAAPRSTAVKETHSSSSWLANTLMLLGIAIGVSIVILTYRLLHNLKRASE